VPLLGLHRDAPPCSRRSPAADDTLASARALAANPDAAQSQWATSVVVDGVMSGDGGGCTCGGGCDGSTGRMKRRVTPAHRNR